MWEIPDQERKRHLKIQDRAGINLGIEGYFKSWTPPGKNQSANCVETLKMIYKYGFRAFVLPEDTILSYGTPTMSSVYKEIYTGLLDINRTAKKYKVELSFHADKSPLIQSTKSRENVKELIRIYCHVAHILDARGVLVQAGPNRGLYEREAMRIFHQELLTTIEGLKVDTPIGVLTSGKLSEIGSLDQVLEIVKKTKQTEPVVNFGHLHARSSGALHMQADIARTLDSIEKRLGSEYMKNPLFYFSSLTYGPSGETGKTSLSRSDLKFEYVAQELVNRGIRGTVIIDTTEKESDVLKCLKILESALR